MADLYCNKRLLIPSTDTVSTLSYPYNEQVIIDH